MYRKCRNVNESNTNKDILSDSCSLLKNKKCGLYFVWCAKIYFVSWKNFSSVEKHFVSQKKFFRALVVKSILSHKQKIYMVLVQWTEKKCRGKKLIVNLFLIFNRCLNVNCSLIFKYSKILIQFHKLT